MNERDAGEISEAPATSMRLGAMQWLQTQKHDIQGYRITRTTSRSGSTSDGGGPEPQNRQTRFARGEYVITLEPVEVRTGTWSVRVTVAHGGEVIRTVDLSKEITFRTSAEALAHGSQFVDELAVELGRACSENHA